MLNLDYNIDIGSDLPFLEYFFRKLLVDCLAPVLGGQSFVKKLFEFCQVACLAEIDAVKGLSWVTVAIPKFVEVWYQVWPQNLRQRMHSCWVRVAIKCT